MDPVNLKVYPSCSVHSPKPETGKCALFLSTNIDDQPPVSAAPSLLQYSPEPSHPLLAEAKVSSLSLKRTFKKTEEAMLFLFRSVRFFFLLGAMCLFWMVNCLSLSR